VAASGAAFLWGTPAQIGSAFIGATGGPGSGPEPFSLSSCLDNAGSNLSLTSPGTWVSALIEGGACVGEYLFVPTAPVLTSFENTFGLTAASLAAPGTHPAAQWVGAVGTVAATFPAATVGDIKATADGSDSSCGISGVGDYNLGGHTFTICDAINEGLFDSGGTWGIIFDVLQAFVLVFAALGLFRLVRGIVGMGQGGGDYQPELPDVDWG